MTRRNVGRRITAAFVGALTAYSSSILIPNETMGQNKPESAERILPRSVTWENVATFEDQVRQDVPIRTPANEVAGYLERWEIKHAFHLPDRTRRKNAIVAVLENLGRKGPFLVSLAMYFELVDDKVDSIRFRLEYL